MTAPSTHLLTDSDFPSAIDDRYFEDYQVGEVYEFGYRSVTEQEIIDFAVQFDPQTIHTDPAWAATGPFHGLIASGWHSSSILMRLFADHYLTHNASLSSPGIDELRWAVPLRPGERVRLHAEIVEARPSRSKPDRGLVITNAQLLSDEDKAVVSLRAMNLIAKRPATD